MSRIEADELNETFRKMVSEKTGMDFVFRNSSSVFLISVKAYPQRVVPDNELLPCLLDCFNAIGFEVDMSSIKPKEDFTWIEMKQGEEKFSVGITNTTTLPFYIVITVTRFG